MAFLVVSIKVLYSKSIDNNVTNCCLIFYSMRGIWNGFWNKASNWFPLVQINPLVDVCEIAKLKFDFS
jgi:hypothetical protein